MSKKDETKPKSKVAISEAVLDEAGPKKRPIKYQPAECAGSGDVPHAVYSEKHMATTLVTEAELKSSREGKKLIRCSACKNEFDNRKKNSKTLLSLRESVWKIDEVLKDGTKYELTTDQINTLNKEREYCIGEIQKVFTTESDLKKFLDP